MAENECRHHAVTVPLFKELHLTKLHSFRKKDEVSEFSTRISYKHFNFK